MGDYARGMYIYTSSKAQVSPPRVGRNALSVARENLRLSALVESQNLVVLGPGAFHPRRSRWHSGNGETGDPRFLLQKSIDIGRRHVPLYQVSVHDRSVTRGQCVRNPERALDLRHI